MHAADTQLNIKIRRGLKDEPGTAGDIIREV
jgi:hypothetical protein